MTHAEASLFQDGFHISERLACLLLDASLDERASGGVDGYLTRGIDEICNLDGLTIRTDGSGCLGGTDNLFHIADNLVFYVLNLRAKVIFFFGKDNEYHLIL
jgi:hypothetical protein